MSDFMQKATIVSKKLRAFIGSERNCVTTIQQCRNNDTTRVLEISIWRPSIQCVNAGTDAQRRVSNHSTMKPRSLSTFRCYCPETDILSNLSLKVQDAFRNLLIHGILPFTALIAFCCVLHRYSSRGIHR